MRGLLPRCAVLLAMLSAATAAFAGPPFLTDDPEPVDYGHYEFYAFSTLDRQAGNSLLPSGAVTNASTSFAAVPAFEFNWGAAPNLQLHMIVPAVVYTYVGGPTNYGVGDTELGAKYRFIQETKRRPQIGVFPMLEVPSGSGSRGLGNGETWARLPLWLQKSWGPWQSYGGAGYQVNHAPGARSTVFAGWQAQRDLSKRLTLGGEWYAFGRQTFNARYTYVLNAGGILKLTELASFLFTAGHSIAGDPHTVAYFGLYWTWGKKDAGADKPGMASMMKAGVGARRM